MPFIEIMLNLKLELNLRYSLNYFKMSAFHNQISIYFLMIIDNFKDHYFMCDYPITTSTVHLLVLNALIGY